MKLALVALVLALGLLAPAMPVEAKHACAEGFEVLCTHPEQGVDLVELLCFIAGPIIPIKGCN